MTDSIDPARELELARATIAAQAMRIRQLEDEAERRGDIAALRHVIELTDIVGLTVGEAPYRALLQGIVVAAARLFNAASASIALLDHETDELVFEAAGDVEIVGMRFPSHQGIAGWVVSMGEALAVADVRRDPRWAGDVAQSTGYVPRSILAVPLFVGEEVEGVLSVLDKANNSSFGLDDMELLGLFARPAAVAVEQARLVRGMGAMLVQELARLAEEQGETMVVEAARKALAAEAGAGREETLEVALLVQRVSHRGERARRLVVEVLESVARLMEARD